MQRWHSMTPSSRRGLEQETALPRDSYLQPYYKDVYGYLRVGPPLLLVVKDLNMSRKSKDINAVCSIAGCRDNSLLNQVRIQITCLLRGFPRMLLMHNQVCLNGPNHGSSE